MMDEIARKEKERERKMIFQEICKEKNSMQFKKLCLLSHCLWKTANNNIVWNDTWMTNVKR